MEPFNDQIKKSCAFYIKTACPLETLKILIRIFTERNMVIDAMNMYMLKTDVAIIILNCRIERDRIWHVQNNLERMTGVIELELLEGKGPGVVKQQ